MNLYTDLIKPFSGESEESLTKRKAYYYRYLYPRLSYCIDGLNAKLNNLKPISVGDREEIDALWGRYMTPAQCDKLIDYQSYEAYNKILREGERLCDYMPDVFYGVFIDDHYGNPQHSKPCDDKNLYDLFFHDINRPKILFRKMYDMILDENYDEISIDDAIALAREQGEVILKLCRFSGCSCGVMFWNSAVHDESVIREFMKDPKDVICQAIIRQHSELSRLNPTSVNTLRIMTLDLHGKIHVLSSVLRMGINGARVDNASSGGIICGIKPNGKLKNEAYDAAANRYDKHPQGTAFESVTIPNYDKCIAIVTKLARRCSSISRLISWDLAIEENGEPLLIEFNVCYGELDFHQLCNGPIFGDLTREVLNDVFEKAYSLNSILKSMK